jgi:hypothetical protein
MKYFLSMLILGMSLSADGQEDVEKTTRHRVSLGIGHTIVGQGLDDKGKNSWLSLPMWVIDYDYSLSRKWSIGVHTDFLTESFKVEGFFFGEETTEIERTYPISVLAAFSFKPGSNAMYSIGLGREFSESGNYYMTRIGFEYGIELPGDWELAPGVTYDLKWSAYDSFSIALAVGKKF